MKKLTQIVLIGHTVIRLIESVKRFPLDKIILVLGNNPDLEGEKKVIETANSFELSLKQLTIVERIYVDKEDFFSATITILERILKEIEENRDVIINVSGSLRQMVIACYIASLVSRIPIYSVIPNYNKNYEEIGIKKIQEIPFIPIKEISKDKLKLIKLLRTENSIDSIDELIKKLYPNHDIISYNKLRAKASYYLKDLEFDGFIVKEKIGKKKKIIISEIGKIYYLGALIRNLKNPTF